MWSLIKNPKSRIYSFFCDCNHSDCTKCLLYIIPFTQLVCFNFIFISINDHRKMLAVSNSKWDCIIATLRFTAHQPPMEGDLCQCSVSPSLDDKHFLLSPSHELVPAQNSQWKIFPIQVLCFKSTSSEPRWFCCFFSMSPLLQIVIYCNALWIANGKMANNVLGGACSLAKALCSGIAFL